MPIRMITVSISITTIVSRGPPYVPDIALNILQVGFDSILLTKGYIQPALAFVNELIRTQPWPFICILYMMAFTTSSEFEFVPTHAFRRLDGESWSTWYPPAIPPNLPARPRLYPSSEEFSACCECDKSFEDCVSNYV